MLSRFFGHTKDDERQKEEKEREIVEEHQTKTAVLLSKIELLENKNKRLKVTSRARKQVRAKKTPQSVCFSHTISVQEVSRLRRELKTKTDEIEKLTNETTNTNKLKFVFLRVRLFL